MKPLWFYREKGAIYMKMAVPTYLLIIGFTILMLVGSSLILTQAELSAARDLHTNCLVRLQASAYSDEVFNQCQAEVQAMGDGWSLDEPKEVTVFEDRKAEKITLNYRIAIPFLGIIKDAKITSYGK